MWRRIVDKALSDNHYVYHFDEDSQILTEMNASNKTHLLADSFGDGEHFSRKHLIISKTPLSVDTPSE
jgi:hypothetical protein